MYDVIRTLRWGWGMDCLHFLELYIPLEEMYKVYVYL